MKYKTGCLIQLALDGEFDVIVHGCNCFNTMGAGIAKTIKKHFPEAYEEDCKTKKGDEGKLGEYTSYTYQTEHGELTVVNGYTQYKFWGSGSQLDYPALRCVFAKIKEDFPDKRIGFPMIGAGLAGGDWNKIKEIIKEELQGMYYRYVKYVP